MQQRQTVIRRKDAAEYATAVVRLINEEHGPDTSVGCLVAEV